MSSDDQKYCRFKVGDKVYSPKYTGHTLQVVYVDETPPPRPNGLLREPQYVVRSLRTGRYVPLLDREI